MIEEKENPQQKSKDPFRYRVCMTLGHVWDDLFENSLARQMANIVHLQVGKPGFQITQDQFEKCIGVSTDAESILKRINSNSTQSSELVWKFEMLINLSETILVDTQMLDTAIGQFVISTAKNQNKSIWAVGVDAKTSPLAPAFINGIVYPSSPDDLVRLVFGGI